MKKSNSKALNNEKNPFLRRKSKNELEGRDYFCNVCNKGYLSYPALYTHQKLKHDTNKKRKKGRGRPKKEQNEDIIEKKRFNPINTTFFAKEERTGKTPISMINICIDKAFNELYLDNNTKVYEGRNIRIYESIEEHPFLSKFKKDKHDIYKNVINLHEITDTIFINYLNKMSTFCNQEYYIELIKFVTLFREHINIVNINKENFGTIKEYTEMEDAENIPNYCNSFINEFLFPKGDDSEFILSKDECIDLIQNICFWMYENNFTSSRIEKLKTNNII